MADPTGVKNWGMTVATLGIMAALFIGGFFFVQSFWQSSVLIGVGILLIFVSNLMKYNNPAIIALGLATVFIGILPLTGIDSGVFWPLFISLFVVGLLSMFITPVLHKKHPVVPIMGIAILGVVFLVVWWGLIAAGGSLSIAGFDATSGQPVTLDLWEAMDNTGMGLHVFCLDCNAGDSSALGVILVTAGLASAVAIAIFTLSTRKKGKRRR